MKKYWVIGHPLEFCLTTEVMNGAFKALDMDAMFETHDVAPDDLESALEKLRSGELAGMVVTRPHKTPSIEILDQASPEVKNLNAVNLIISKDGQLHGENIDWVGAVEAIKTMSPELSGKKILVLGAGGAARATALGMHLEGAEVAIWNRTTEKAQKVAEAMGLEWVEDMRKWDGRPDIIINATASSDQASQSTLVPYPVWENVNIAMDAVYGKTSLFLEEAQAAQVSHIISGEIWFLKQVLPLFKLLTGQDAPIELIEELTHGSELIRK